MRNKTAIYKWKNHFVPDKMKFTQVYGLLFSKDGRMFIRTETTNEPLHYSLLGGRPEKRDCSISDTCRREVLEEVNITISDPIYIGYQEVDEGDDTPPMHRLEWQRLLKMWGKEGKEQIEAAVNVMTKKYGLTLKNYTDEHI